jgi:hypothetical protein
MCRNADKTTKCMPVEESVVLPTGYITMHIYVETSMENLILYQILYILYN